MKHVNWLVKLIVLIAVSSVLTSCSIGRRLFVAQSDDKPVWCPPSVLEPCEALKPPASTSDEDFKAAARSWIEDYKVCKLKQQIVADCIEQHNQTLDNKKAP